MEMFEEKYKEGMGQEEAMDLALAVMNEVADGKVNEKTVELAVIDLKTKEFKKLSGSEVKDYISKVKRKAPPKGEE
jgi:proteasome alpha subunit